MELQSLAIIALSAIGFISLSKSLAKIITWIWVMFLRPGKDLKSYYGSWAVITDCTDGIGKALSLELASKGLNLILLGRNPEKLEATSQEIKQKYGRSQIETKSIVIDFAKESGEGIRERVEEGIRGLDVGILVNNAGLAYPFAKFFHEVENDVVESVIRVNLEGLTWVTKAVVPAMVKKNKGAILNIGSGCTVALSSYPLYTVYAATKGYVEQFSKCLGVEYKQHGIDIQCQVPLLVATKMASLRRPSFWIPSPETYSKASVRAIGYERICMPCLAHSLQTCLLQALPDAIVDWCLFQYFVGMRERGLKKEEQKKK